MTRYCKRCKKDFDINVKKCPDCMIILKKRYPYEKTLIFSLGVITGALITLFLYRKGVGNNNGSEFWGDKYVDVIKNANKGIAGNSGSKFYSDTYIKEKFKNSKNLIAR